MNDRESLSPLASPASAVLLPALSRLGLPVLLFGVSFLAFTAVLTMVVTPDRFPVRIGDRTVRLADLEDEQKSLLIRKVDLETKRGAVTELRAPVLHQLALLRESLLPVGQVFLNIEETRAGFRSGDRDPISLPMIEISGSGSRILLGGQVRTQGDHSMQVLASFVDGLRSIPMVSSVSEPEYTQRQDADDTTVSPFTVTLSLSPHVQQ